MIELSRDLPIKLLMKVSLSMKPSAPTDDITILVTAGCPDNEDVTVFLQL